MRTYFDASDERLKRVVVFLMFILSSVFVAPPSCHPQVPTLQPNPLDVELVPQKKSLWCWAASSSMIMNFLKHPIDQCVVVSKDLSLRENYAPVDCCGLSAPNDCNAIGYPTFCQFHFDSKCTQHALSWGSVVKQLRKEPFAFLWRYAAGGGHQAGDEHVMVAIGYASGPQGHKIIYNDPAPPGVGDIWMVSYEDFVAKQGAHEHVQDYYDVLYDPGAKCPAEECQ